MNKTSWFLVVIIIILIGGFWYYESSKTVVSTSDMATTTVSDSSAGLATYQYECDEHVTFALTTPADMSYIKLEPTGSSTYPPVSTLTQQTATSGALYVGGGVTFAGHGETVTLSTGDSAINCSPVQNPDAAPLNFGD